MTFERRDCESRSRFVEAFWSTVDISDGEYLSAADACWDLIVVRSSNGSVRVLLSGPSTRVQRFRYRAGSRNLGIRFLPGIRFDAGPDLMIDCTVELQIAANKFCVAGSWWALPQSVSDLAQLVDAWTDAGLLCELGMSSNDGGHASEARARQRRIAEQFGISARRVGPILRARIAANQLSTGAAILDVVNELGYSDQAHLSRDLRRFTGLTPRQSSLRDEVV